MPARGYWSVASRRSLALARSFARGVSRPTPVVFLGRDVELRNRNLIQFGRGVTVGRGSVIDGLSQFGVTLGDSVNIGAYSIIEATGAISNLGKGCSIGDRSALGSFSFIGAAGGVTVGSDVIMGNRVSFHSENHTFDETSRPIREQGVTRMGIVIQDDCWIGANVTILDGARVGTGCVIGAGSVVRGEIPPFSVAVGVPARVVNSRLRDSDSHRTSSGG